MADVLIFDDDPSIGDLAAEVLRDLGLSVEHYLSGAGASQIVQESRPRLVLLDIMMPGLDGLSACRAIKSNAATRHVKVIVATSKDFPHEKERALRYGADFFMPKPLRPEQLALCVARLLGLPERGAAPAPAAAPPVTVTLLDRGAVLDSASLRVLFDAGRQTADWLREHPARSENCWLLLSCYTGEEGAASRSAQALLGGGCRLRVAGPETPEGELQLLAPSLTGPDAQAHRLPMLFPQREGEFRMAPGVSGTTRYTRYPGTTLAYRVSLNGRKVVYCPWHRPPPADSRDHEWGKFLEFFRDADLLLHGFEAGVSWEAVTGMAQEARVKRLVFLPLPDAVLAARAQAWAAAKSAALSCLSPAVGESLVL